METDGTLTNFKVMRSVGDGTDEEAIRVLALSPKWTPGLQNGHKVRVAYTVPINFTLSVDNPEEEKKTGGVDETGNQHKTIVFNQKAVPDTGKIRISFNQALYSKSNAPVVVVDGVQVDNLDNVVPDDIQSVSILKDKSSIALYGDKAKNGVILVTTKKKALKLKQITSAKN